MWFADYELMKRYRWFVAIVLVVVVIEGLIEMVFILVLLLRSY